MCHHLQNSFHLSHFISLRKLIHCLIKFPSFAVECRFCERLFPNNGKGRQAIGTHETGTHSNQLDAIIENYKKAQLLASIERARNRTEETRATTSGAFLTYFFVNRYIQV